MSNAAGYAAVWIPLGAIVFVAVAVTALVMYREHQADMAIEPRLAPAPQPAAKPQPPDWWHQDGDIPAEGEPPSFPGHQRALPRWARDSFVLRRSWTRRTGSDAA